jgi:RNA polymerase sigma-70 factor (ECF subfamily)
MTVSELPDDQLVERVARGEQPALLHLYDRHASRVYSLALRVLSDPMTAEEITQDVFVKLWARADSYLASRGTFSTWLLSITRHAAIDRLRAERRRPALADDEDIEEGWGELPSQDSTTDEARWRDLYFAVRALPRELRQVIELAYYHGMSHSQIAKYLNWPVGTVKTRLRTAMERLRQEWLDSTDSPGAKSIQG